MSNFITLGEYQANNFAASKKISGGSVTLPVWNLTMDTNANTINISPYNGNDTVEIFFIIYKDVDGSALGMKDGFTQTVTFTKGNATVTYQP